MSNIEAIKAVKNVTSFLMVGQSNMAGRGDIGEVEPIENGLCHVMRFGVWQPMSEPVSADRGSHAEFVPGVCLATAFADALGDKKGIVRYGSCVLPMDESLILSAVDLSGRDFLGYDLPIPDEKVCITDGLSYDLPIPTKQVGSFDTELVQEFWLGFVRNAGATLHIRKLAGTNSHHIIEGTFKSVARTLRDAVAIDARFADVIPSTKGVLQ